MKVITISAKASLSDGMGRQIIGHIISENDGQLGVKLVESGDVVWVDLPEFDFINHCYVLNEACLSGQNVGDTLSLSFLWPVQIKIINTSSGRTFMIYSFSSYIQ